LPNKQNTDNSSSLYGAIKQLGGVRPNICRVRQWLKSRINRIDYSLAPAAMTFNK